MLKEKTLNTSTHSPKQQDLDISAYRFPMGSKRVHHERVFQNSPPKGVKRGSKVCIEKSSFTLGYKMLLVISLEVELCVS